MHRRTLIVCSIAAAIVLSANSITIRIPFIGEQEADGYMLKTGWPCAFWERTRHRNYWEWRDVAIDAIVATAILGAVAFSSEWTIRRRKLSYTRYLTLSTGAAVMIALNLYEMTTAERTVRGWPVAAIINGDWGDFGIHHNRIDPTGAAIDGAVAVACVAAFVFLLKVSTIERRLSGWLG
jgi:hypothetical protein